MFKEVSPTLSLSFILLVAVVYTLLILGATWANQKRPGSSTFPIYLMRILGGGFLLITGILGMQGFFLDFDSLPPRVFLGVIAGFIGALVLAFHPRTGIWLREIPQSALVLFQSFRIVVEIQIYYLASAQLMPKIMTFEGRNWDILVGLSAPVLAHFIHHAKSQSSRNLMRKVTITWNCVGLVFVTYIATLGALSSPTSMRIMAAEPPNMAVGLFPFVWLPMFLVPCAYLFHFLSLRKSFLPES